MRGISQFNFRPKTELQKVFAFSTSQKRFHILHYKIEVLIGFQKLDVFINSTITPIISPNMHKLVLISNKNTEVPKTMPMENILVGIHKTYQILLSFQILIN